MESSGEAITKLEEVYEPYFLDLFTDKKKKIGELGITFDKPAVDIKKVAELAGLEVKENEDLSNLDEDKKARQSGKNLLGRLDNTTIMVDKTVKDKAKKRFIIAHELGHYVFEHDGENNYRDSLEKVGIDDYVANDFAGKVLVPRDLLLHVLNSITKEKKYAGDNLSDKEVEALIDEASRKFEVYPGVIEHMTTLYGLINI